MPPSPITPAHALTPATPVVGNPTVTEAPATATATATAPAPADAETGTGIGAGAGAGRPRLRRRRRLVASLSVLAVTLLAATASTEEEPSLVEEGGAGASGGPAAGGDAGASAQPQQFAVGDLVELGDWQVRVHGVVDPQPSTNEFVQPSAGHRWVAVDAEVTNTGAQAQVVSSIACFEIMDGQNRSYSTTFTAEPGVTPPDGEVAAGDSRRGTLTYEVPVDAAGLRLNFSCDLFAQGTATIALG